MDQKKVAFFTETLQAFLAPRVHAGPKRVAFYLSELSSFLPLVSPSSCHLFECHPLAGRRLVLRMVYTSHYQSLFYYDIAGVGLAPTKSRRTKPYEDFGIAAIRTCCILLSNNYSFFNSSFSFFIFSIKIADSFSSSFLL